MTEFSYGLIQLPLMQAKQFYVKTRQLIAALHIVKYKYFETTCIKSTLKGLTCISLHLQSVVLIGNIHPSAKIFLLLMIKDILQWSCIKAGSSHLSSSHPNTPIKLPLLLLYQNKHKYCHYFLTILTKLKFLSSSEHTLC